MQIICVSNNLDKLGTYKMVSGEMQRSDGTVEYPFGKDAIGYLAYTADDFMWFEINTMNRTPFKSGDWFGTKDENEEAMKTHLSLCGRYKIEGDELHYRCSPAVALSDWARGYAALVIKA